MGAQMMKKKISIILAVIAVVILATVIAAYIVLQKNPNLIISLMAKDLAEDEVREVSFEYEAGDPDDPVPYVAVKGIPVFRFTPAESTGYTVSITDIKCDADVRISLSVMDDKLEDYAEAENYDRDAKTLTDSFTAEAALQASQECFILAEAEPENKDTNHFSGSFKISISKSPEEEKPPEVHPGEKVTLKVGQRVQACAVFTPPQTGYYRFSTSIDPERRSTGYSLISSVKGSNRQSVGITDGICMLEEGKEYYVWVSVHETNRKKTDVILSCDSMESMQTDGKGAIKISGDTVIEYRPAETGNIAVYSESDGDPRALIYEKEGFPLRTDNDTEASMSENTEDFALAFSAGTGETYRICVYGEFTDCTVIITGYTGDGSTLTRDDVEPLPEPEAEDDGAEPQDEESPAPEAAETEEESGETETDQ